MMKTYVLYHGNCADGFTAAWVAARKCGEQAEYIAVNYGTPPPPIDDGAVVYILDFSYPRDVLEALHAKVSKLVVLDHHHTAKEALAGLDYAHFDMDHSGARLAWDYFYPDSPAPPLVNYVEDRDLWRFKLDDSREISAAIRSYEMSWDAWDYLDGLLVSYAGHRDVVKEGTALLRLQRQMVNAMCKHARIARFNLSDRTVTFRELLPYAPDWNDPIIVDVPVANATVFFSEVGERLLEIMTMARMAAYYSDRSDGKRQWGLRSRSDYDCSVIAKAMGGGGHKQASGFVTD